MLFERIESSGLAHYSYLIGDRHEAVVIDPRRDCEIYLEKAARAGYRITHILETHRNEDYVVGSLELAAWTQAEVWHADSQLPYRYGEPVQGGQVWDVGRLSLKAIHTPGHTPGSMSYLLSDSEGNPWMIFSGDALFAGDVGRVDLLGMDRAGKLAGLLYDSLIGKLLPLGDEVIVCPAHGAGSVCGSTIADRAWTTIGLERLHNPKLQYESREAFISSVAQELERPPYFRRMEVWNVEGPPVLGTLPVPTPLLPQAFAEHLPDAFVLDTRANLGYGASHVPNALSIWMDGVASYAGWFVPYDRPLLLLNESDDPTPAVRHLLRLGYDEVVGTLAGGMLAWQTAGRESSSVQMLSVHQVCRILDAGERLWILDVRSTDELRDEGTIRDAHHIHITQLVEHLDDVPVDQPVAIFCGSGLRSMIAASLLRKSGHRDVSVVLGGLAGWDSTACPVEL